MEKRRTPKIRVKSKEKTVNGWALTVDYWFDCYCELQGIEIDVPEKYSKQDIVDDIMESLYTS